MSRWFALGIGIAECALERRIPLRHVPLFVGVSLACIWFPGLFGEMLGRAPYAGAQFFQVPERFTRIIGWVLLLLPALSWLIFGQR